MSLRPPYAGATATWPIAQERPVQHIVLSSPGSVAEGVIPNSGRRVVLDAVTAHVVDGDDVAYTHHLDRYAGDVTFIPIDPALLRGRRSPIVVIRQGQPRLTIRTVVLSPAALLLAHRLRARADDVRDRKDARRSRAPVGSGEVSCFIQHLLACADDRSAPGASRTGRRSGWQAIADGVRERLARAPSAPHRIADLAAVAGVSPFHLARLFRVETGLSVHQYLLRLRMASALDRLSSDPFSLSRLALDLGFSSHSHFTAAFRRQFDASPANVRTSLREGRMAFRDLNSAPDVGECLASRDQRFVRLASHMPISSWR